MASDKIKSFASSQSSRCPPGGIQGIIGINFIAAENCDINIRVRVKKRPFFDCQATCITVRDRMNSSVGIRRNVRAPVAASPTRSIDESCYRKLNDFITFDNVSFRDKNSLPHVECRTNPCRAIRRLNCEKCHCACISIKLISLHILSSRYPRRLSY